VVSIPVGQGVRVTVAFVPPVKELEIVCVQFSAVIAYVIPGGVPVRHGPCIELSEEQGDVFLASDPD
jgi:hypothetical protein